jgi:hypothetical protein
MNYKPHFFLFLLLLTCLRAQAQKQFAEGTISYKVKIMPAGHSTISGTYTFIIKGNYIRKEIKLNNGYQDVVLIDCITNKVFSLQTRNGKKYAIELNMGDLVKLQQKYGGFIMKNEQDNQRNIAGYAVYKGDINYQDGTSDEIYYTKEWQPCQSVTFERFPNANFFPMYFSYKDENNLVMQFEVEKMAPGPIENAIFRIPPDYKMISNEEYKELCK